MKNAISIVLFVSVFFSSISIGQGVEAEYEKTTDQARKATRVTKYPEIESYIVASKAYCVCWFDNTNGGSKPGNYGIELTKSPICEEDTLKNVGGKEGSNVDSTIVKSDPIREMQSKQQRMQLELTKAQSESDIAYQSAISNGRNESGAILDATVAGASQISNITGKIVYTGVGIALSLLMRSREKKQDGLDKQPADRKEDNIIKEEERKTLIIEAKGKFIEDALKINQYDSTDFVSKERYASVFLAPEIIDPNQQQIYFSIPVKVPQYSDNTYPLVDKIVKNLLQCLDKSLIKGNKIHTLYPITNISKFENDFTGKMGSGHLISLNAALLKFSKTPFSEMNVSDNEIDFWGTPSNNK